MASRTIGTVLSLRDNMSRGIIRVNKNVQNMSKETKRASQQVARFANKAKRNFEKVGDKAVKLGATMAGVVAAIATKMGFSEALDMEGYKVQLETAVKDTKKAGELMTNAVKFANKTPFETGSVIGATAKMEMYGLSSKRWLVDIADMAGSTNKSIMQATEAMADAGVGEFERLKEFGLKKDMILEASNKMYGENVVFNTKGQVKDQEKLMNVLQSMMQEKFKGGAEKLSKTTKGMWSTITGVTKTSLAKIVGMQENGTIKQGSLLDKVKIKVQQVADKFQQWQQDGTIEKIADKATKVFTKLFDIISKVIKFLIDHRKAIENVAIVFGSFYVAIKIMTILKGVIFGVQIAMAILNGTLIISPLGWITLAIAGLIAIGVLLWKNWDTVKVKAQELWDKFKLVCEGIKTGFVTAFNIVKEKVLGAITGIIGKVKEVINNIKGIFKLKGNVEVSATTSKKYQGMRQYAIGGIAYKPSIFGEAGEEMAIPLKRNNPRSKALLSQADRMINGNNAKSDINVNVVIQGNIIGNEQYADYIGNKIVGKVKLALNTM